MQLAYTTLLLFIRRSKKSSDVLKNSLFTISLKNINTVFSATSAENAKVMYLPCDGSWYPTPHFNRVTHKEKKKKKRVSSQWKAKYLEYVSQKWLLYVLKMLGVRKLINEENINNDNNHLQSFKLSSTQKAV